MRRLAPLLAAAAACAAPGEPVTPQRPGFTFGTTTTAEGTYEVEWGVEYDRSDALNTPLTLKYGLDERTEVFVAGAPYQWVEQPGSDAQGLGDTIVGARRRFRDASDDAVAFAAQALLKIPTANESEGLGSGELDAFGGFAFEGRAGPVWWTWYSQLGVLNEQTDGGTDLQYATALGGTIALTERLSAYGEVAGVLTPERDSNPVFATTSLIFAKSPDHLLDASLEFGLSDDAPDFRVLFGSTINLGRGD